jgi:hypothetical protein
MIEDMLKVKVLSYLLPNCRLQLLILLLDEAK